MQESIMAHINRWLLKGKQVWKTIRYFHFFGGGGEIYNNSLWKAEKNRNVIPFLKFKKMLQEVKTTLKTVFLVAEKEENTLESCCWELVQMWMFLHVNTDALFICLFYACLWPRFCTLVGCFSVGCCFWAIHSYFQTIQKPTAASFTECLGVY